MGSKKADIRIQFKDVPGDIFKCMHQNQIELSQISTLCNDTKTFVVLKCYATGQKQGRNEFVIRLQPSEAMYMKLTVSTCWTNHNIREYVLAMNPLLACHIYIYQNDESFFLCNDGYSFNMECFGFVAQVKQPGLEMQTVQSELDLSYKQRYQDVSIPEAYERLILDTYESKNYVVTIVLNIKTVIHPICWRYYESLRRIKGDQQHFVRRDELKVILLSPSPLPR